MARSIIDRTPDIFQVGCDTGTGECVGLAALLRERRSPTALERKRWPQVAAHIGAGLRLRNKLRNLSPDALPVWNAGSPPAYWGAATVPHAPVTPVPPGAEPRSGNPQLLGNLAQRPAAARQQPHRLSLEFICELTTRCTHQTPSCSHRSLSEVSTISREGRFSISGQDAGRGRGPRPTEVHEKTFEKPCFV